MDARQEREERSADEHVVEVGDHEVAAVLLRGVALNSASRSGDYIMRSDESVSIGCNLCHLRLGVELNLPERPGFPCRQEDVIVTVVPFILEQREELWEVRTFVARKVIHACQHPK